MLKIYLVWNMDLLGLHGLYAKLACLIGVAGQTTHANA